MAPTITNRIVQLAAQPTVPNVPSPIIQSYYTVHGLVEMVDAGEVRDSGVQITLADSKSLRMGQPQRHALTALMKDGVQQMTLPPVPRGVQTPVQGMLGPVSQHNITEGSSWVWTAISVADKAACAFFAASLIRDSRKSTCASQRRQRMARSRSHRNQVENGCRLQGSLANSTEALKRSKSSSTSTSHAHRTCRLQQKRSPHSTPAVFPCTDYCARWR